MHSKYDMLLYNYPENKIIKHLLCVLYIINVAAHCGVATNDHIRPIDGAIPCSKRQERWNQICHFGVGQKQNTGLEGVT